MNARLPARIYRITAHGCTCLHLGGMARLCTRVTPGTTRPLVGEPLLFVAVAEGGIWLEVHRTSTGTAQMLLHR